MTEIEEIAINVCVLTAMVTAVLNKLLDNSADPDAEIDAIQSAVSELAESTSMDLANEADRQEYLEKFQTVSLQLLEGLRAARERRG